MSKIYVDIVIACTFLPNSGGTEYIPVVVISGVMNSAHVAVGFNERV